MKAVILAAGYATRLYPLTENKPKCLLEVSGKTILDWICGKIDEVPGLDEIVIVTNARFYDQLERWRRQSHPRLPVRLLNDGTTSNDNRLGAIGDLQLALGEARIASDVLMLASDNLFDEGLGDFTAFASARNGAVTVAVYDIKDPALAAKKYGVLEADAQGRVIGMEEKPEHPRSSLIGMGVYYFPAGSLGRVAEYLSGKNAQDAPGHYIRWLSERGSIFCYRFGGMWYDIGDLRSLEEADRTFKPSVQKK